MHEVSFLDTHFQPVLGPYDVVSTDVFVLSYALTPFRSLSSSSWLTWGVVYVAGPGDGGGCLGSLQCIVGEKNWFLGFH